MQQVNPKSGTINLDPDKAEHGLAQLVLTVVELLRQIVERHAIRRVEGGTLSDEEIERLGEALMNLEEKMEELREVFGLEAEDLNIDLGPLGSLL
ncbi:gas vesicle protein K [Jeotgalibacillus terrae]|uniref:Gas vesicle protein GvpK n=2 Tax=Jeotgalibacillus TaxID=157226 RepID=A0A0B5AR08_9BACL|nr:MULTISPECIES: gas vesicle protein K [Jeotgalibacillus]AJD92526.1 gas vesicle protein GvpK [Jeotgalibacillus malaysiensis]MBM7579064.1 CRISPR/Cas system-associated endonuclease Cas1 [Jeotgalibacillus terrae]